MSQTVPDKKTILHLSRHEAEMWCLNADLLLIEICLHESFFIEERGRQTARSIEGMMYGDGRRAHGSPHIKRISQLLAGDHRVTVDLMMFLTNMSKMLKGERRTPFENEEMSQDEARSWLPDTLRRLLLKLRHDPSYLQRWESTHTTPHEYAATAEQITKQQDIVLLLDELLKTYPPLKISRPKPMKTT